VQLLNFIFELGVVFAIFGFLWGLIQISYLLLRLGKEKSMVEEYSVKMIKYFFLVNVTFLYCYQDSANNFNQLVTASLILLIYFVGKLQKTQSQVSMFEMVGNKFPIGKVKYNLKAEIVLIVAAFLLFVGLLYSPQYAYNPISIWFNESIASIENAVIFGFLFRVIGFLFLVNVIFKMLNALSLLLSGQAHVSSRILPQKNKKKDDDFDNFEEID
jgi:hypothetical protein